MRTRKLNIVLNVLFAMAIVFGSLVFVPAHSIRAAESALPLLSETITLDVIGDGPIWTPDGVTWERRIKVWFEAANYGLNMMTGWQWDDVNDKVRCKTQSYPLSPSVTWKASFITLNFETKGCVDGPSSNGNWSTLAEQYMVYQVWRYGNFAYFQSVICRAGGTSHVVSCWSEKIY